MPDFIETPLRDVVDYLKDHHRIEIRYDRKALYDAGSYDVPITMNARGISLRSALKQILGEARLTYIIRDEAIVITSEEEANDSEVTKVYDVHDLVTPGPSEKAEDPFDPFAQKAEFKPLIEAITAGLAPRTWRDQRRSASIAPFEATGLRVLIISQSQPVHEQVEKLLRDLRAARRRPVPAEFAPKSTATPSDGQLAAAQGRLEKDEARVVNERLHKALGSRITEDMRHVQLDDALKQLSEQTGVALQLDRPALGAAEIDCGAPVEIKPAGRTLRSVLDETLRPLRLTWTIAEGAILVTTPKVAATRVETRVYNVADLLSLRDQNDPQRPDYTSMMVTITSSVAPKTWQRSSGPGTIKPFDHSGVRALVVSQTPLVHDRIAVLLATLRKAKERQ